MDANLSLFIFAGPVPLFQRGNERCGWVGAQSERVAGWRDNTVEDTARRRGVFCIMCYLRAGWMRFPACVERALQTEAEQPSVEEEQIASSFHIVQSWITSGHRWNAKEWERTLQLCAQMCLVHNEYRPGWFSRQFFSLIFMHTALILFRFLFGPMSPSLNYFCI